jgi:hypothetical protein
MPLKTVAVVGQDARDFLGGIGQIWSLDGRIILIDVFENNIYNHREQNIIQVRQFCVYRKQFYNIDYREI